MTKDKDRNAAMKVLDALDYIAGFAVTGVSNTTISNHLGLTKPTTSRLMNILIDKGWVRKDETTGHFHPTPRMGQVFGRVLADIARAKNDLDNIEHNFSRTY